MLYSKLSKVSAVHDQYTTKLGKRRNASFHRYFQGWNRSIPTKVKSNGSRKNFMFFSLSLCVYQVVLLYIFSLIVVVPCGVTVTSVLAPLMLGTGHAPCSLQSDFLNRNNATQNVHVSGHGCPKDREAPGKGIDVVGLALKETCVNVRAVQALNEFLGPDRIIIITRYDSKEACTIWESLADNVHCMDENSIIPGVTKDDISQYLTSRYSISGEGVHRGRQLAGWYFQQLLKLGAGRYIKGLSQYFLVWDMDMIMLRPMNLFSEDTGDKDEGVHGATPSPTPVRKMLTNRKPAGTTNTLVPAITSPSKKIRVHIGGKKNHIGAYERAYERLFHKPLEYADDGSSFVTHHMLVYKPYMEEFLHHIESVGSKSRKLQVDGVAHWVYNILGALDEKNLDLGFSEYASYYSFLIQRHPEAVQVLTRKKWTRNPFMSGLRSSVFHMFSAEDGVCCPSSQQLLMMRRLGYEYTGIELGHNPSCSMIQGSDLYGIAS